MPNTVSQNESEFLASRPNQAWQASGESVGRISRSQRALFANTVGIPAGPVLGNHSHQLLPVPSDPDGYVLHRSWIVGRNGHLLTQRQAIQGVENLGQGAAKEGATEF